MDTTQRDELANTLKRSEAAQTSFEHKLAFHQQTAGDLLAAGYRKPRTIATVEELDALPVGTVILDGGNMGAQWDGEMWSGEGRWWHSSQIPLPATVLWEPEAEVGA